MKLYSYVVARDYGFAPNPFFGICSLATCKPQIRGTAQIGDWIVGTGSKRTGLDGYLVFAMRVEEALTYDDYWHTERFRSKRPQLKGSRKQAFGDNIYHRHPKTGRWLQENSHHSLASGRPNIRNIKRDTSVSRVLLGTDFTYWGKDAPKIPEAFRDYDGHDLCHQHPGHKCHFPNDFVMAVVALLRTLDRGYAGLPREFHR